MRKERSDISKEKLNIEVRGLNEVHLRGRVSATPVERILPSGDLVVEFRLIVSREKSSPGRSDGKVRKRKTSRRQEVDTLDIAAWSAKTRRSAASIHPGTWVEVQGAVRRRFWQAPAGLASRWQVEAESIKRL